MKKVNLYASVVALFFSCFAKPVFAEFSFSNPTDYFRSAATGNWGSLSTWETSPDNGITPFVPATLIPTTAANYILISKTDTVTVSSNQNMDQVMIEGILYYSGGVLTINDDPAGDDVQVMPGGVLTLAFASNPPVFSPSTATVSIYNNGILRVSATGLTFAAPNPGVNTGNYIYQDRSVLEYTPGLPFATSNVIYFPNVDALTIPIFRITNNIGLVGASTTTRFNGVFEANGDITFDNTGTKVFRNGLTGTGNINGATSGKFIIDGLWATLNGTGIITLPTVEGMDIGPNTGVGLISDKTFIGNINLLSGAKFWLGGNKLIVSGIVTGGSATSYIVTNPGVLVINNVGSTPVEFPIGPNGFNYNPIIISNGGGLNYAVGVRDYIFPPIAVEVDAVNRTWYVTPTGGNPGNVNVTFFYTAADCNAGWSPPPANLELGFYTTVWNVIQTGLVQIPSYQVSTTISNFSNTIQSTLVLANIGAILASSNSVSVDYFTGARQNNKHILNWKLNCNSTAHVNINMQRSTDGSNYENIYHIYATALRCEQPFNFNDDKPAAGINYYRIKMTDADGNIFYSNMVTVKNEMKNFEMMIIPHPVVNGNLNIKINAAEKAKIEFVITDLQGSVLQKQIVNLFAGFNSVLMNVAAMPAGTYCLTGYMATMHKQVLRFVIQ